MRVNCEGSDQPVHPYRLVTAIMRTTGAVVKKCFGLWCALSGRIQWEAIGRVWCSLSRRSRCEPMGNSIGKIGFWSLKFLSTWSLTGLLVLVEQILCLNKTEVSIYDIFIFRFVGSPIIIFSSATQTTVWVTGCYQSVVFSQGKNCVKINSY